MKNAVSRRTSERNRRRGLLTILGALIAIPVAASASEPSAAYAQTGSREWGQCAINSAPAAVEAVNAGARIEWNTRPDDPTVLAVQRLMALCSPAQDVERERRDPNWRRIASTLRRAKADTTIVPRPSVLTLRCVESLDGRPFRYDIVRRTEDGDAVVHRSEFVYADESFVAVPEGFARRARA